MGTIFIDGDFPVKNSECEYYCSPSCHPAQIGPIWLYGCTHEAWPQNQMGDFVPIVDCGGTPKKCNISPKYLKSMLNGYRRRVKNAYDRAHKYEQEIKKLEKMISK